MIKKTKQKACGESYKAEREVGFRQVEKEVSRAEIAIFATNKAQQ